MGRGPRIWPKTCSQALFGLCCLTQGTLHCGHQALQHLGGLGAIPVSIFSALCLGWDRVRAMVLSGRKKVGRDLPEFLCQTTTHPNPRSPRGFFCRPEKDGGCWPRPWAISPPVRFTGRANIFLLFYFAPPSANLRRLTPWAARGKRVTFRGTMVPGHRFPAFVAVWPLVGRPTFAGPGPRGLNAGIDAFRLRS